MKRLFTLMAAFCLLAACEKTGPSEPSIPVTSVSLDQSSVTLGAGESVTLKATVLPDDASNKSLAWSSSVPNVAIVDNSGRVSAKNDGQTIITVTTNDGNKTATCAVTVDSHVDLEGISFASSTLTLTVDDTYQLKVQYKPENATNRQITWSSSKTSVAKVSDSGLITAVSAGDATITATSKEGGFKATCKVTVKNKEVLVYTYTGEGVYRNGQNYDMGGFKPYWFFAQGDDLYEGFYSKGIYKNGTIFCDLEVSIANKLMGVAGTRLYFFDRTRIKIYDTSSKKWIFDKALQTGSNYGNYDMVVAQDGTAYVVGEYEKTSHNYVACLWTISKDLKVTESELKRNGTNEHNALSIALDASGNRWILTYNSSPNLNLYKNGSYVKTIRTDPDGNVDHYISCNGNDRYIVSTTKGMKEVVVYKNESVLYRTQGSDMYTACSKAYFANNGDVYFGASSYYKSQVYIYKNGKLHYTLKGLYIGSMAVIN